MERRHRNRLPIVIAIIAAVLSLALTGCGDDSIVTDSGQGSTEKVELASVFNGFRYYGACGNESVVAGETRFYPVLPEDQGSIDVSRYPVDLDDTSVEGLAPLQRVAEPGPGDDVGTMLVYVDGLARFESDSGRVIWLTDEEQTYNWEC